ncbi:MAG TPA: hypothetical protein VGA13_01570 [Acidimicrobiales bacterium]
MRRLAVAIGVGMAGVTGAYTLIYLYRWEWNRAIIVGLFFVATEVAVVAGLLTSRLRNLDRRLDELIEGPPAPPQPPEPIDILRAERPEPADRFGWLREQPESMNVFLPVLLGAGVLASIVAWAVEHLARLSAGPLLEVRLADRLGAIAPPSGGFLGSPIRPDVVRRSAWPRVAALVAVVALLAGAAIGIDELADQIQTRPESLSDDVTTTVEIVLRGEVASQAPEYVAEVLWAACTGPDVFSGQVLPEASVAHHPGNRATFVVAADLGRQGRARLSGCLNDVTLHRVQAAVVGMTTG